MSFAGHVQQSASHRGSELTTGDTLLTWNFVRAACQIANAIEPHLAAEDLSLDQWLVIEALSACPGSTMAALHEQTSTPAPTLTRIIDRLVARAVAFRDVDAHDRRKVRGISQQAGLGMHSALAPRIREVERSWLQEYNDDALDATETPLPSTGRQTGRDRTEVPAGGRSRSPDSVRRQNYNPAWSPELSVGPSSTSGVRKSPPPAPRMSGPKTTRDFVGSRACLRTTVGSLRSTLFKRGTEYLRIQRNTTDTVHNASARFLPWNRVRTEDFLDGRVPVKPEVCVPSCRTRRWASSPSRSPCGYSTRRTR